MESPITRVLLDVMGVLYMNDTDFFILDDFAKRQLNIHIESQSTLSVWWKLLILTGWVLKPDKCFYHTVDYDWQGKQMGCGNTVILTKLRSFLFPSLADCRMKFNNFQLMHWRRLFVYEWIQWASATNSLKWYMGRFILGPTVLKWAKFQPGESGSVTSTKCGLVFNLAWVLIRGFK